MDDRPTLREVLRMVRGELEHATRDLEDASRRLAEMERARLEDGTPVDGIELAIVGAAAGDARRRGTRAAALAGVLAAETGHERPRGDAA